MKITMILFVCFLFYTCNGGKYKIETRSANGILETQEFYENGKLIHSISFYPNGAKRFEKFYDKKTGLLSGPYFEYHDNGTIMKRGKAVAGELEDTVFVYYNNNRLQEIEMYKKGRKDGQLIFYHINGRVGAIGNYVNDSMDGKWTIYNMNGEGIITKEYSHGRLISLDSIKPEIDSIKPEVDVNAVEITPD
jgi:antitoxin component YwqK of YwqJK toxin-antitoxin module